MSTLILTDASSGAPALSGTNGALNAVLDWALVQNGWAIEYTAANARVYRAATGLRNRLSVQHDSAVSGAAQLATIRGCESATSATALVDPFPQVAQIANNASSVMVSTLASTLARPYLIILTPTFVAMFINAGSNNVGNWDGFYFGDLVPTVAEDAYYTMIGVGGTSGLAATARLFGDNGGGASPAAAASNLRHFWCRSIDGSIKATRGCFDVPTSSIGQVTGAPAMRGGFMNRIVREKLAMHCAGVNSGAAGVLQQFKRGWMPNMWVPLHINIGSITSDDTFTDTAYNASALFQIIPCSGGNLIVEKSDTWSAPSG